MAISFPRAIIVGSLVLFGAIGVAAAVKKKTISCPKGSDDISSPLKNSEGFPCADRMRELFEPKKGKLPFVETITYHPSVSWLKGKPAWIADYADHYMTSRHFIARSLGGSLSYFSTAAAEGDLFNVFSKDHPLEFYLLVDTSRCKMALYCYDRSLKKRFLLKDYRVGLGKKASQSPSGCLTPLGRFKLSEQGAIYKPGMLGRYHDQRIEMIQVFGTRWIPFSETVMGPASPKGYGIQGAPFERKKGEIVEKSEIIGKYGTEGGICLERSDMEEVFSIITTRPTYVEIVTDFRHAELPGSEE